MEESFGQCPFPGPVALPRRHHPPRLDAIIMNARFTVEPDNLTSNEEKRRKQEKKGRENKKKKKKEDECNTERRRKKEERKK